MKTWLSLVLSVCVAAAALGQTPVQESQKLAIAKYPALADSKSKMNQKFLELLTATRASDPSFLQRDDWPVKLADRAATALGIAAEANTDDGKVHSTALNAPVGRVTIHGNVLQRMDSGLLISTQRGIVLLRGYDGPLAREGKTLTVPATKAEPYDYTDLDGAKRRVDSYQSMK